MKRSYKQVAIEAHALLLDGKQARTPMGNPLALPNEKLADSVAAEWQAQKVDIRKDTMPLTHIACVAIDLVSAKRDAIYEDILPYGDTDLVCYRAGNVPVLEARQEEMLAPIVAWSAHRFGIILSITNELMPIPQSPANQIKLRTAIAEYDDWKLAVLASITKPLGSLILALALCEGRVDAEKVYQLSHLEEEYETEQWGEDSEKTLKLENTKAAINAAAQFLILLA